MKCNICPRQCKVDRTEKLGYCQSLETIKIGRIGKHFFEEPPISGTMGSGAIFFCGCSLRCVYCQNHTLSKDIIGKDFSPYELSEQIKKLEDLGSHNINLVTPTHYVDKIIETLEIYRPKIPIVYNTSGYEKVETIKRLNDYIDIYLPDFKYGIDEVALNYSAVKDYKEIATKAIFEMLKKTDIYENEIMKQGVIIRHLVLPNNVENSKKVLDTIKKNFGNVNLSIMSQYTPIGESIFSELNRKLKPIEYKIVVGYAEKLGFDKVFIQLEESASEEYIPTFYSEDNNVFL